MKKEKNLVEFLFLVLNFDAEAVSVCLKSLVGGVSVCMFSWIPYCKPSHSLQVCVRFLVLNEYLDGDFLLLSC